jgi:hypothetical protein
MYTSHREEHTVGTEEDIACCRQDWFTNEDGMDVPGPCPVFDLLAVKVSAYRFVCALRASPAGGHLMALEAKAHVVNRRRSPQS